MAINFLSTKEISYEHFLNTRPTIVIISTITKSKNFCSVNVGSVLSVVTHAYGVDIVTAIVTVAVASVLELGVRVLSHGACFLSCSWGSRPFVFLARYLAALSVRPN